MEASTIEKDVVVNVPVRTAYNQWTQFEKFPEFMQAVQEVKQIDDKHLRWRAKIAGKDETWDAEITEQVLDRVVAWRAPTGAPNEGRVEFQSEDANRTRVKVRMRYMPRGALEKTGDTLQVPDRQVKEDLDRFKAYIEKRGQESGAWRGEIPGGKVEKR